MISLDLAWKLLERATKKGGIRCGATLVGQWPLWAQFYYEQDDCVLEVTEDWKLVRAYKRTVGIE